jgi:disulfide bond formation protein DsbB
MRTTLLDLIRTAATVLLGLYAGGVFFVVLAPSLRRLPGDAYVRYWQSLNTDYARAMPPMLLTCLALMVATCALSYRHGRLVFGLGTVAVLLTAATIVLTVTQMEPLNRLADTWDPTQLPADWAEVRQRWLTLHTARTVIAVLAFIAFLAANTLDRTPAASAKAGPLTERPPVAAAP